MFKNKLPSTKNTSLPFRWVRTSRRNPCPICSKYGFCEITDDNRAAHCMFIPSRVQMQHRLGGWLHELTLPAQAATHADTHTPTSIHNKPLSLKQASTSLAAGETPPVQQLVAVDRQPLSEEQLDQINRTFLKLCPLSQRHREFLLQAGIEPGECGSLNYSQAARLAGQLVKHFGEAVACQHPIFYRVVTKGGSYYWTIAGAATGLLFPAVNLKGQILGIQVRKNWPHGKEDRYRWLSHAGLGGTPLSIFQAASSACNRHMVIITEGYKKAALAAKFWECHAISLAGVSEYREEELLETIGELRAVVVALAFDQDKRSNPLVSGAELKLVKLIAAAIPNCENYLLNWRSQAGKGIDDALFYNTESPANRTTFRLDQVKYSQQDT